MTKQKRIKHCRKCGSKVIKGQTKGYTYTCLTCDEDLFTFETI